MSRREPGAEGPKARYFFMDPAREKRMRNLFLVPVLFVIALIAAAGCAGVPAGTTATPATVPAATIPATLTMVPVATIVATVPVPAATPDPYPQALAPGTLFRFGSADVASEGTVYRYWINDTYQWHNDLDNRYYTEKPAAGYKYLIVFVHMTNIGGTRVWYPKSPTIAVRYDGKTYTPDPSHFLPDRAENAEDDPIEVKEIQFFQKLDGDEYVEDFGYSHGTTSYFLYPGESNSLDGYIIYMVPASLVPERTYVVIPFNGQDTGVWRLG
jgi:hypothetical protein